MGAGGGGVGLFVVADFAVPLTQALDFCSFDPLSGCGFRRVVRGLLVRGTGQLGPFE